MRPRRGSWLRRAVLAWGLVYLAVAVLLLVRHTARPLALYLALGGIVLVAGIVWERSRYRPVVDPTAGEWRPTGERFIDPVGGQLVEVRYNPATGERAYIDVGSGSATGDGEDGPAAP